MTTDALLNVTHSIRGQKWINRASEAAVEVLLQACDVSPLAARLLAGRGVEPSHVSQFLSPKLRDSLPDPSSLMDMDKTVALIFEAIDQERSVCIFADYDVDGGTSAAQLLRWARGMGQDWSLYVPDRLLEGYGPSVQAFEKIKTDGTDLVITVDCGAAAHEALSHATDIGLDIIVIDHHLMDESRPKAKAIVNPNRQDDTSGLGHLAAAGVTFMTVVALNREAKRRGMRVPVSTMELLGLASLGTICDVVPLTGLNRAIVAQGLKVLSKQKDAGIQALADVANLKPPFTTRDVGFGFGPRINAGGRIGVSHMGAELLLTENAQLAYAHAAELDRVNAERRAIQDRIQSEAMEAAAKSNETDAIIVVAMKDWHPGIIGIVAGRIKDKFNKPAIVIGIDDKNIGKGSGRSIKGVNLGEALAAAKGEGILLSGGGHEMAGGLAIDPAQIKAFKNFISEKLSSSVELALQNQALKIDALIHPKAVSLQTLDIIDTVGPYGAGNPSPVFAFSDVIIDYAERLKGHHVRVSIKSRDGTTLRAMAFGAEDSGLAEILLSGGNQPLHIAGQIKRNEWNGRISADFHILDVALV